MPRKIEARAQEFEFDAAEQSNAYTLSFLNECHIRNVLAQITLERSKIAFDPTQPLTHVMQFEFLRGQIAILEYLLELHELSKGEQS